ncbi:B-box zinc finger protein 23 [Lactuca sativa]|uniref:B box-type domain-containing protein n=1 Tax=Lactuca sativa TaxID=4236 RepID=A0A9R1X524_LACSA|nr:B-box zinc finger protein 23 [Lactuca sativa]KAJ0196262.1 hypothetical protein LSAT_V11C700382090 [Lactuca sativa]
MKIQCNVCEMAEATVLCCADEAALCWSCDEKIHAANKLASKHQRVLLSNSNSQMPKCDICQETVGYFFCLEDRALLCRKCDVAIHTVNTFVSSHQRFLLTGVKVGQEATEHGAPLTSRKSTITKTTLPLSPTDEYNNLPPVQTAETDYFTPTPSLPPVVGSSPDGFQEWQLDDYLRVLTDINCIDNVPSKVNDGNCSPILKRMEAELDEGLGQVPDASWAVPQMWPKNNDHHHHHHPHHVPDVCYTHVPDVNLYRSY